jgi:hypothetical protein
MRFVSAVPAGRDVLSILPGVETPGYFQNVPLEGVTNSKVHILDFIGQIASW